MQMFSDLALVSEADPESGAGQVKTLLGVGYRPVSKPTPTQLEQQLLGSVATTTARLLVVVGVVLAKACANAIEHNTSQRLASLRAMAMRRLLESRRLELEADGE